jgi:small subunit ribosomal protein S4
MVSHGHILVNGKRNNIPSHKVSVEDTIGVREASKTKNLFLNFKDEFEEAGIPSWLTFDLKKMEGTVTAVPTYRPSEMLFDAEQVLQYYSR